VFLPFVIIAWLGYTTVGFLAGDEYNMGGKHCFFNQSQGTFALFCCCYCCDVFVCFVCVFLPFAIFFGLPYRLLLFFISVLA
jgi:hypothetical protein